METIQNEDINSPRRIAQAIQNDPAIQRIPNIAGNNNNINLNINISLGNTTGKKKRTSKKRASRVKKKIGSKASNFTMKNSSSSKLMS
jgi:hypothetical protein